MKLTKYFLAFVISSTLVLSSIAQVFELDTTFQPFAITENASFRDQPVINGIIEEEDGRIYAFGYFLINYQSNGGTNYSFYNSICLDRDGDLFLPYNAPFQLANFVLKLNDSTYFHNTNLGTGFIQDGYGKRKDDDWVDNSNLSVKCASARPLFFDDGSSIFANRRDNSGKPCKIIVPPDTFKGSQIIKLKPNGVWDSSFWATSNHTPWGFVPYDSNRIFVYGPPDRFTRCNGKPVNGICRININSGELDTTFVSPLDTNVIVGNSSTFGAPQLVADDGRFFISGHFYLKDYPNHVFTLIRCHADGSLDTSFNNFEGPSADTSRGGNIEYYANKISSTDDGGYLVGGTYNYYQGYQKNSLAKIDSNGFIEPHFFTNTGPDSASTSSLFPSALPFKSKFGGYYIVGNFLKWDGKPSQPILRIKEVTTSLEEKNRKEPEIEVFPNPSQSVFNVQSTLPIKQLILFNLSGSQLNTINCTSNCSINLSNYSSGVYLLRLILDNGAMHHRKLIKH